MDSIRRSKRKKQKTGVSTQIGNIQ
jgi:hypothetical protein